MMDYSERNPAQGRRTINDYEGMSVRPANNVYVY